MNLYDNDYLNCTEELLKKSEQIEKRNTDMFGFINSNYYFELPKEVRHYKSMFPNNFLDIADFTIEENRKKMMEQNEQARILINNQKSNELELKKFIKDNRAYHIIGSILKKNFNFGHHGAYIFPEFQLGSDYKCDYLIIGDSSDGFKFVFVEMESINDKPQINKGYFSEALRKGINQINDWQMWLEKNFGSLNFKKYKSKIKELPEEFFKYSSTRMNYVIVCGRRKDYDGEIRDNCRKLKADSNILVINHDNLIDASDEMLNSEIITY